MTQGLTTNGWFFLIFGWGFILTLTICCFSRVLFGKKPEVVVDVGGREQWGSRIGLILAAAGQIFFTLSLGQGIINTYASYFRQNQDVTL